MPERRSPVCSSCQAGGCRLRGATGPFWTLVLCRDRSSVGAAAAASFPARGKRGEELAKGGGAARCNPPVVPLGPHLSRLPWLCPSWASKWLTPSSSPPRAGWRGRSRVLSPAVGPSGRRTCGQSLQPLSEQGLGGAGGCPALPPPPLSPLAWPCGGGGRAAGGCWGGQPCCRLLRGSYRGQRGARGRPAPPGWLPSARGRSSPGSAGRPGRSRGGGTVGRAAPAPRSASSSGTGCRAPPASSAPRHGARSPPLGPRSSRAAPLQPPAPAGGRAAGTWPGGPASPGRGPAGPRTPPPGSG